MFLRIPSGTTGFACTAYRDFRDSSSFFFRRVKEIERDLAPSPQDHVRASYVTIKVLAAYSCILFLLLLATMSDSLKPVSKEHRLGHIICVCRMASEASLHLSLPLLLSR